MKFHHKHVIGSKNDSPETTETRRDHCHILIHIMTETSRSYNLKHVFYVLQVCLKYYQLTFLMASQV